MSAASNPLRPVGFRPWEISALVNREVIDQHAEEAAFLWTQRDHATGAPQYALKDLAKLDGRVEAHVDGLRIAGPVGWDAAVSQLEEIGPGEAFAVAVLAFGSGDAGRINAVLPIGCSKPRLARGLISALGWLPENVAVSRARELLASTEPEIRRAGIAGISAHRADPGPDLERAIANTAVRLAGRAMKAAAELGRRDLLPLIVDRLAEEDAQGRFWAAWSAVRLGHRSQKALVILQTTAETPGPLANRALDIALRAMPVAEAHLWRERLSTQPATARLAVCAAGVIGDPAAVPELIAAMESPKLARDAGRALAMITGVNLGLEHLEGDAPEEGDDDDASAEDVDSPWPIAAAVRSWWVQRAHHYIPGTRYLCGREIADRPLRQVLVTGRQNQRAAAAMELALRSPGSVLFETRERAQWQQIKVRPWTS